MHFLFIYKNYYDLSIKTNFLCIINKNNKKQKISLVVKNFKISENQYINLKKIPFKKMIKVSRNFLSTFPILF